jgi:dynein heavy chain 1
VRHNIVINTIVNIHNTVSELNQRLSKSAKKFNYITPRDFLDFIKQFTTLYNSKKSLLEEQQLHLNSGLDKLRQTENQVLEMQSSLDIKKLELEKKEREASTKMSLIVTEKTNANEQADLSTKLKVKLDEKQKEIAENKKKVEDELSQAEPAL